MAVFFAALASEELEKVQECKSSDDNAFLGSFRSNTFSDSYKPLPFGRKWSISHFPRFVPELPKLFRSYSPWNIKIFTPKTMPELKRFKDILYVIHRDCNLEQHLISVCSCRTTLPWGYLAEAEAGLRNFNIQNISRNETVSAVVADLNPILKRAGEKILRK